MEPAKIRAEYTHEKVPWDYDGSWMCDPAPEAESKQPVSPILAWLEFPPVKAGFELPPSAYTRQGLMKTQEPTVRNRPSMQRVFRKMAEKMREG